MTAQRSGPGLGQTPARGRSFTSAATPDEPVVRRHVGVGPIPSTTWATVVLGGRRPRGLTHSRASRLAGTQQAGRYPALDQFRNPVHPLRREAGEQARRSGRGSVRKLLDSCAMAPCRRTPRSSMLSAPAAIPRPQATYRG